MVGWHHQLDEHGFMWTLGVGDGQGGLACCGSLGHKESDTTKRLNLTEPVRKLTNIQAIDDVDKSVAVGCRKSRWITELFRS